MKQETVFMSLGSGQNKLSRTSPRNPLDAQPAMLVSSPTNQLAGTSPGIHGPHSQHHHDLALSTSGLAATMWSRAWQPTEQGVSPTYQHAQRNQPCHNWRTHTTNIGDTPRAYNWWPERSVLLGPIGCLLHKATYPKIGKLTDLPKT